MVHVQEELSLLQVVIIKQVGEMKKYGTEIFGTEKYGIENFFKRGKKKKTSQIKIIDPRVNKMYLCSNHCHEGI